MLGVSKTGRSLIVAVLRAVALAGVATAAVASVAHAPAGASVAGAPPLLSFSSASPDISSSYGSGIFGRWTVDPFGLPAYRYTMDQRTDPRARQVELAGGTNAWSQVGNDNIVADAYNQGYTQLWSQDRLPQWTNRYDPTHGHYAGGYGYLNVDGKTLSTLYDDEPAHAHTARVFGVGYYRHAVAADGVRVNEVVYAPFGNDPVLGHDVTITNTTHHPEHLSWFEYWDVNPYDQQAGTYRGIAAPRWQPASQTLSVAQRNDQGDTRPLSIFAAQVVGHTDAYDTTEQAFFGAGTGSRPAAVAADQLSDSHAAPVANGSEGTSLFAFQSRAVLTPGHSIVLRYLYGTAHPQQIAPLVAKYRQAAHPYITSEREWKSALPKASFGSGRPWLGRELEWDAYLLRSATVYEEACGEHTITQGGYYEYQLGLNLGTRSWLHYLLPMTEMDPRIARQILVYTAQLQPRQSLQLPYGTSALCTAINPFGLSDDFDFWLVLAAAQYGLATRDTGFFNRPVHFYDSRRTTSLWHHIKLAVAHQQSLLGPHGEYRALSLGDWSDFSATYLGMTESTLVVAQCAYAYPRLAELADLRGDRAFAIRLRRDAARLLATLRGQWTGKGWYSRGYAGNQQLGYGVIWLEPQPWAILAGAPTPTRAATLVANIRRYLDGIGAPAVVHGPDRIGTSLSPARNDPGVSEFTGGPGIGDNNAVFVGGTWFDPDGWLTWAYATLDGVLPRARRLAFNEYVRTTLANHATVFPDSWDGITSVDDTCWSFYSSDPARCGGVFAASPTGWEGQNSEQPTWMVMGALDLAGITPTEAGYQIAPHFPFQRFSVLFPTVGVAGRQGELRGYVKPVCGGNLEMQIAVPPGAHHVVAWVGESQVTARLAGSPSHRTVEFQLPTTGGSVAHWSVTWHGGAD